MTSFTAGLKYDHIRMVHNFGELISTEFQDGVNALCWPRALPGDFGEIVEKLGVGEGITTIDDARLLALDLSEAGQVARDLLIQDLKRLHAHDLEPQLDCIRGYPHEADPEPLPTHVQSFHVDSATAAADTFLCTYFGPTSEGLRNKEAVRRVDVPDIRSRLLELYGGEDDGDFLEYLNENFHDLHYVPLPGAQPYSFGTGNLWRIACAFPGSPVPPCIHRAPATIAGGPPRLLLIS